MPLITEPLAHLEMMLDDLGQRIEDFQKQRIIVETKVILLQDLHRNLAKVLDEERAKLSSK